MVHCIRNLMMFGRRKSAHHRYGGSPLCELSKIVNCSMSSNELYDNMWIPVKNIITLLEV